MLLTLTATSLDALGLVVLGQGDEPLFIGVGHRAMIADENQHHQLGVFDVGQAVLLVVCADQARPLRGGVADVQFVRFGAGGVTTARRLNGHQRGGKSQYPSFSADHGKFLLKRR